MNISSTGSQAAEIPYAAASTPAAAPPLPAAGGASPKPAPAPAQSSAPAPAAPNDSGQAVDAAIKAAADVAQRNATAVEFAKDMSSGRMVVRVVDTTTQKVLRQMPSEEMIALGQAIDGSRGTMIDFKA
jgi:flagellar protein FlaG